MKELTSRQRLTRCFKKEETDRPGIVVRGVSKINPKHSSYKPLKDLAVSKCDLVYAWHAEDVLSPYPIDVKTEPHSDDFLREVHTLHTPKGDLVLTSLVGLSGQPGMIEKRFLESMEDVEKYLSLPLPELIGDCSGFFEQVNQMGDRGIVYAGLGNNPAGTAAVLFGTERFALFSYDHKDILHRLMQRRLKIMLDLLQHLFSEGVGPFFSTLGQEYITPPIHSPGDFGEFNLKYDKRFIDYIHENNGGIHIHCHGSIKHVLKSFVEMGADVLHPLEAPPSGNILPSEAKQIIKDRICFEGNIQIADLCEGNKKDIEEQVSKLIEEVYLDHKGLIVSASASPYIPVMTEKFFENYKTMIETVLNYEK